MVRDLPVFYIRRLLLNQWNFLFWMESIAVWAFAAAWLTKGRAIFAEIGVELLSIPTRTLKRRPD